MDSDTSNSFNDGYVELLYQDYLSNPESVSPEWRTWFERDRPDKPSGNGGGTAVADRPARATAPAKPAAEPELPAGATLMRGAPAAIARNMDESLAVPTATSYREVAVSRLDRERRAINAALADRGRKLSFTHLVAWAIVLANRDVPVMSHRYLESGGKPYRIDDGAINLGIAVDVKRPDGGRGLMVPAIKGCESIDALAFFDAFDDLVARSREGKIGVEDMMGTTISLTNPGGIGTSASVPRLMKGTGTIVATGAIGYPAEFADTPKGTLAELGISKVMTVSSTYDHRIIQGAESGEFLRAVDTYLQGGNDFFDNVRAALGIEAGGPETAAAAVDATMSIRLPGSTQPQPVTPELSGVSAAGEEVPTTQITSHVGELASVAAAMALVKAFRTHGHLAANLDPLGSDPIGDPSLDPDRLGLTEEIMRTIPASVLRLGMQAETLADALPKLRERYCGTIAYEIEHISSHEQRVWLRRMIESGEHRRQLTAAEQERLLRRLTQTEAFERYVRRGYLTQKQFSIEGLDMLVPILAESAHLAAADGARAVVIGMAHRGRLNVLAHILGASYASVLREFEAEQRVIGDTAKPKGGTGDVKYHHGREGTFESPTGPLQVSLSSNPSHLEAVDPVVVGRTRAVQTLADGSQAEHDPRSALAVLIHGDAAFPGQGIVAETLNLGDLPGYATGGTLHIIANNQLGFTTPPEQGRSTRYASDLAKGFDIPIIHVNADDPEACIAAARLALAFRSRFRQDVLIDLIGYRRHGHNEGDEPAYTQPVMYRTIAEHARVRETYAKALDAAGVVKLEASEALYTQIYDEIANIHEEIKAQAGSEADPFDSDGAEDVIDRSQSDEPETAVAEDRVRAIHEALLTTPDSFNVHPKLQRQLERRRPMLDDGTIDWGTGEALALGSLLADQVPVRLTGQDAERGTFAHRHMRLHDVENGETFTPIAHLPQGSASFELYNSPLSEAGCMGFEYGYSVERSDALVLWEAQFGDFVNGAQVVIDQFLMSGLAKWGQGTRLTLLLPHGYEGNGPEHSNARLARFLSDAAEGNCRIANCTTPAQIFHLLRRQALIEKARPLVVMTPKSLLRHKDATSTLEELTSGRFEWVIEDSAVVERREAVTRLVFCSGKVYYDLAGYQGADRPDNVAFTRVELLYPFPKKQVSDLLATYPNLSEVLWVQEEPANFGPAPYVFPRLRPLLPDGVELGYVGRPRRSSTSEGYTARHLVNQEHLVREALGINGSAG